MANSPRLPFKFWLVAAVALINAISFTIIIPTLYPYAKEFGLSDFQASLLTTSYAICQFFFTPILGRLSDRLGRKPLLIVSLLGTVGASLLAAVTPAAWLLYLARMLDGVTGGNNSVAQAIISDMTTADQRPQAFGIFGGMFRLGFVLGPPLAYLAQSVPPLPGVSNLGMSFVVSAAIALLAAVLCFFFVPETRPPAKCTRFRLSWSDFGFDKLANSFRSPTLGRVFVMTFLVGGTFTIFTFAFQPFFLNVLGQDERNLALTFVVFGVLAFVSQVFLLEPLRKTASLVNLLAIALVLRGLLFIFFPAFPNITAFWVGLVLFGVVNAFPAPLLDALVSLRAKDEEQGEALGTNSSYLSISNAIGPAISGLLVSVSYSLPFFVAGGLTLAVALFALTLRRAQSAAG